MRLPKLPLALLCSAVLHTGAFAAQDPPTPQTAAPAPEIAQHDAAATFTSRSNLVEVPVVVRDKQGRPLANLTKDDFFLFDKGKPQYISRFTVERAGTPYIKAVGAIQVSADAAAQPTGAPFDNSPAAPAVPERFITYLIDDVHLNAGDLLRMRNTISAHIDKTLDPVTRVAIVSTSGQTALDFTGDLDRIHEALSLIKPYTPPGAPNCPALSLYQADQIVNFQNPGLTALMQSAGNDCTNGGATAAQINAVAITVLTIGEGQSRFVTEELLNVTKRMSAMPGARMVVLVSPGFLLPGNDLQPEMLAVLEAAVRNNVVVNTLDARGVYAITPGGNAEQGGLNANSPNISSVSASAEALALEDVMEELADGTGGRYFHNDNGFAEGLDELTRQPDTVYLLGFSPSDLKYDGTYHKLKVSLKNPELGNIQARRGYYAPKRPHDPNEAAKEDIREAVFSRDELLDIPVDVRLQFFKSSPTTARLSVISHIDVKNLHFRKDQDRSKDTLVVVAGLFDRNGNFVSGTQRTLDMALRDQTLNVLSTNGISVPANFEVTPGNYTIRVVVRDAEGQMMAARNGVVQIP